MHIRLGILGADDSTEVIRSVAQDYEEFECLPIVYWKEEEVIETLKPHVNKADIWIFSGQVPYSIAKEWGGITQPMFYVPHVGSSLYKTLLNVTYTLHIGIDQLSFDTFSPSELEQFLDEVGIHANTVHNKYYPGEIKAEELAQYHYELWKSGETRAAITCLRTAHLELQRLGVPVFRILPAKAAIQSILNLALRTHEMLHFKDTQIAVLMIEIDSFNGLAKETFSTDELYNLEIKLTERLLKYAKTLQGSLKSAGPGRYVIFTTRGLLRDITRNFTVVPPLEEVSNNAVSCGIGIGLTAYEAEIHAGKALLYAKEHGKGSWMVFFDDKTISGPLGEPEQLAYSYVSDKLQEYAGKTTLSISTLGKLESILRKLGKLEINAHELAQYMQIQPRSARRILLELEQKGLAQVTGEENPHLRGRPRKIYRILL